MTVRLRAPHEVAPLRGADPHVTATALCAEAQQRGGTAVVADVEVPGLRVAYPLLLERGGTGRRAGTDAGVRRAVPGHGDLGSGGDGPRAG